MILGPPDRSFYDLFDAEFSFKPGRDRGQVHSKKLEADQWSIRGDDKAVNKISRNHLKRERGPSPALRVNHNRPQLVDEPSRNDNQRQADDSYPISNSPTTASMLEPPRPPIGG